MIFSLLYAIVRPWKESIFNSRCQCNKELLEKKKKKFKSNRTGISEGKPLKYPYPSDEDEEKSLEKLYKTFQIKYKGTLSSEAKSLLNSFQNKYIYYAIDDLLYLFELNLSEQEKLLNFLYSSMLSLHNDFSINFFEIWIDAVYINDINVNNRFLVKDKSNSEQIKFTCITLTLYYVKRSPIKKAEAIW